MIDFPISELLDEEASREWLERQQHPKRLRCPKCGSKERRVARKKGPVPAYRCLECDCYHTIFTGTVFEKTRQKPSKLVLLLRGIAKGESTARLARELPMSRKQVHTLRRRIQLNLLNRLPSGKMAGAEFEGDELYQNAGEKKHPTSRPTRSAAKKGKQAARTRHI